MISVIVCSIDNTLLKNLKTSIKNTIGVNFEVIVINNQNNSHSIASAYNAGAFKAIYPYLCFVHEDILFHTQGWGEKLINHLSNKTISLVGILGAIVKTKTPSGVFIPIQKLNRVNQLQKQKNGDIIRYYENPLNEIYSEVAIVDGMFLATTKAAHDKHHFDDNLLKGFHGYDIEYSLGQAQNCKIVVVYDILIEHLSSGGNTVKWIEDQLKVTTKWGHKLPISTAADKSEILEAEIINTEIFLASLFANNYKKQLQLKYLIKLLALRPFNRKNFYFVRKFILPGQLETFIKTSLLQPARE